MVLKEKGKEGGKQLRRSHFEGVFVKFSYAKHLTSIQAMISNVQVRERMRGTVVLLDQQCPGEGENEGKCCVTCMRVFWNILYLDCSRYGRSLFSVVLSPLLSG